MRQKLYDYSPIVSRPQLVWPGGHRMAFYIGLNIEHYLFDVPSIGVSGATLGRVPDPMNYGWRDYGVRAGFWRILRLLDDLGLGASVLLNSQVCEEYPDIIEAGVERNWTWLGHGQTNSVLQQSFEDPAAEQQYLVEMTETIASATGARPKGWLGPALSESFATPRILAGLGYEYTLDWCNDDQPYPLNIPGMFSVPYHSEINDIGAFLNLNMSGPQYEEMVTDQFEQLMTEAESTGMVMALPIHPFVVGQPFRFKYLERALRRIVATDGVWFTSSDEIAKAYAEQNRTAPGERGAP